jgi:OOP family OmpA-OmpF porin
MMVCGFLSTDAMSFELITKTETVVVEGVEIDIVKTADNFIVLFDSSSSMGKPYKGTNMTKIEMEKKILKDRNQKLPDLKFTAGAVHIYTESRLIEL